MRALIWGAVSWLLGMYWATAVCGMAADQAAMSMLFMAALSAAVQLEA